MVASLASLGVLDGLVLCIGNNESPINYADNAYRFRQDSGFLYYFGVAEPGMAASIDLASNMSMLYIDESTIDDLVWTGPRPRAEEYRGLCGADQVAPRARFAKACVSNRLLYTPPYRADTAMELASISGVTPEGLEASSSTELIRAMVAQREVKEGIEIDQIEAAVNTSIAMHQAVMAAARPGVSEAAMMAQAYKVAYAAGGAPSFPAIATTRGDVLHNHGYSGELKAGGLFLLDAGAETVEGYSGDLTSTFPISGPYSERQGAIYDMVLDAGSAATATMGPGVPYIEAHMAAAKAIARGLKELGIMRGDTDEAVAAGAHACFFPHGVGHQMGLDVHDMENLGEQWVGYDGRPKSQEFGLKSLRMAKPLKPGMVITVEPGVYFIEGLIAAWKAQKKHEAFIDYAQAERWIGFGGVRNEEDWLVTATGTRRMGMAFDKSRAAIEAYRA